MHYKTERADKIRLQFLGTNARLQALGWFEAEDEVVAVEVGELRCLWQM